MCKTKIPGLKQITPLKVSKTCEKLVYQPEKSSEKIIKITGFHSTSLLFTDKRIYVLDHLKNQMTLKSEKEYSFRQVSMVNETSIFFIDKENYLYYMSCITEGSTKKMVDSALEDPVFLNNNGNYSIVRHHDPYSEYAYRIFGSVIPKFEWNQTIIYQNNSFHTGLTLNNTIIFYGNKNYMYYKTDLGGFVRSQVFNVDNLFSVAFSSKKGENSIIILQGDELKFMIRKKVKEVKKLELECDPETRLVRMVDESHAAEFLTKLSGEELEVAHRILWHNPINLLGWVLWIFFILIGLIALMCILVHIFNYRKDSRLLEKIRQEKEEEMSRKVEDFIKKKSRNVSSENDTEDYYFEKSEEGVLDYGSLGMKKGTRSKVNEDELWRRSLAENLIKSGE